MLMYDPPHPGRILAENFDAHFTVADTARKRGVPASTLAAVVAGQAPITTERALLLAGIFPAAPPCPWPGLQADYDAGQATHDCQVLALHHLPLSFLDGVSKAL